MMTKSITKRLAYSRSRLGWKDYFFNIAKEVSKRSDCIRMQVGAVIIKDNRIQGTGYNNSPEGVEGCLKKKRCYRIENNIKSGTMYETCRSIHAEMNAIIQAGRDKCIDATMYIYGHSYVCDMCKRAIINAGIVWVCVKLNEKSKVDDQRVTYWKKDL